jgi:hypothetical protein
MVNERKSDKRKSDLDYSAVEYDIGYFLRNDPLKRFRLSIRINIKKNVYEVYAHYFFRNVGGKIRPKPYDKVIKKFDTFEEAKDFAEKLYKSYR